jgi:hypothetical protein
VHEKVLSGLFRWWSLQRGRLTVAASSDSRPPGRSRRERRKSPVAVAGYARQRADEAWRQLQTPAIEREALLERVADRVIERGFEIGR